MNLGYYVIQNLIIIKLEIIDSYDLCKTHVYVRIN